MTETTEKKVSRFREALPQVLASSANNFFRMNVSLSLGFATVVIAQLHNADDPLSLDDTSASWLGSIAYICQPLGSVASGVIVELIGRKKFLIALNIPFLIGLILLCTAPSYAILLLANVIIGITVGLTEAPNNSYNGEVCQPELRGAMSANSGKCFYRRIFYQLGFFMQFLLGSLTHWRTAAAISTVIPIATLICVSLIPEVPIWLISRGRHLEAEKALRWLRGWVSPNAVQKELSELVRYHDDTKLRKKKPKNSSPPSNQNTEQSQSDNSSPEIADQLETIIPKITNNENQPETSLSSSETVGSVNNQTQHLKNHVNALERNIPMSKEEIENEFRSNSQNQTIVPKIVINDEETCSPLEVNKMRSNILPAVKGEVTLNKELSTSMIQNEAMSNYNRNLTIANTTFVPEKVEDSSQEKESEEPTGFQVVGVVRDLFRPPTLRPLLLVVPFFFFVHFAGLTSIRPYMVLVFRELQMPISAEWFTVVSGGCGLIGSILLMVFVRLLGKRLISLVGTALSAGAVLLLGVYTYIRPEDETGALTSTWIPFTEGKSLEEIEQHFTQGISATSKIGRKKGKKETTMSTHL
ncbi:hypothetical protein C0J52_00817 [Blattella germanica]|nr:hypothetical protein C0J52_00817 [Blattella germanica]